MKNLRFQFSNASPSDNHEYRTPNTEYRTPNTEHRTPTRIKCLGVGGCGGNAINTVLKTITSDSQLLTPDSFIAINTDRQALSISNAHTKVQIGISLTKGFGSGGDPEIGKKAIEENIDDVKTVIKDTDVLFIIAGMGGGTGTGASPTIAKISKQSGAFTVAIVTFPFDCEGNKRALQATAGISELKKYTDAILLLHNQKLLVMTSDETPLVDAFELINQTIAQTVQGLTEIILLPGLVNVDFADIRTLMSQKGDAFVGVGTSKLEPSNPLTLEPLNPLTLEPLNLQPNPEPRTPNPESRIPNPEPRALYALQQAINSPFLTKSCLRGASGILINISAGKSLTLFEAKNAISTVRDMVHHDANIIFGIHINPTRKVSTEQDEVKITIIATGIKQDYCKPYEYSEQNLKIPAFKRKNYDSLSFKKHENSEILNFSKRQNGLKS